MTTEPRWNCDLAADDGCIIRLRTGETLVGYVQKIVQGESVELRLLSGPRRRLDWKNIEEGIMAPIGNGPSNRPVDAVLKPNPTIVGPVRQRDDSERPTAGITIQGMPVGMRLQRRIVPRDKEEDEVPWNTICSGVCREAVLADGHQYRIIQQDGMYEEFSPRPWTKRLEISVSPGVRSFYRGGVSFLVIGTHAVFAGLLTAALAWEERDCPRYPSGTYYPNCSNPSYPGRTAFGIMFGIGLPMTIAGIALTAKGNFGVRVHDPSPVPNTDD